MNKKPLIFINYRQIDCLALANSLADSLKFHFGKDIYFLDKENLNYKNKISEEILRNLNSAKIVLALIGTEWILATDQDNDKRLLDPSDWVRREIEIAKEKDKMIIPVLAQGVKHSLVMDWLKRKVPSLAFMADLHSFSIHSFEIDCKILLKVISEEIGIPLSKSKIKPVICSKDVEFRKELKTYFPILDKYKTPKAEIPFMGLGHFKKEDAPLFFGRTSEILKLCRSISNFGLILLYGQSGVGKSSLIDAGILPRLEDMYKTEYKRRNKLIGYHQQLATLLAEIEDKDTLVILDQLEEIYTDKREDWRDESTKFWSTLTEALSLYPVIKFILVFRSEHYPRIKDLLNERQIHLTIDQEFHLTPLNLDGIQDAIVGVSKDSELSVQFKLRVEEDLATLLSYDLLKDGKQESHIGPILQYQLRKLWDDAYSKKQSDSDWVFFTTVQYKALRDGTLDELLDDQLAKLESNWRNFLDNGLVIEVLNSYTTDRFTATQQSDIDVLSRHEHIDVFPKLFDFLKNKLMLLISCDTDNISYSRLAHDSLAPLIRFRFQNSNALGQQAWRLVEAKSRKVGSLVTFSESDIDIILLGHQGMSKIPDNILNQILEEKENYSRQKKDRLDLAIQNAEFNIEHLQFEKALKNLRIAWLEGINDNRILELAWRLKFPLKQLKLVSALEETMAMIGGEIEQSNQETDNFEKYFPLMREVKGGEFDMGSEEGNVWEMPIHKVKVSNMLVAATPVTWNQFGLFCLLTGRDIPNDSGFGRGNRPVINVNWYDAVDYCNWLSEKMSSINRIPLEQVYLKTREEVTADWSKNGFRLPTEAEWEYLARERGKKVLFGNGMDVADPSKINFNPEHILNEINTKWYIKGKGLGCTNMVKQYSANALGLYDMSGNVYEWCWDWDSRGEQNFFMESNSVADPVGPTFGEKRLVRGGSWLSEAANCRCSFRGRYHPRNKSNYIGFRVVRHFSISQ
jgi:formylglycine-generating enzyme required for sulfatase activity